MKLLITFMFVLLALASMAQKQELSPDLVRKNNIRTVEVYTGLDRGNSKLSYRKGFDKNGNQVFQLQYDTRGNTIKYFGWTYNATGQETRWQQFNFINADSLLSATITTTYTADGRILIQERSRPDSSVVTTTTWSYILDGDVVKSKSFTCIGCTGAATTKFNYNEDGQVMEKLHIDIENYTWGRNQYDYDSNGNLIREVYAEKDAPNARKSILYSYNDRAQLIDRKLENSNVIFNRGNTYTYSEIGLLNVEYEHSAKGLVLSKTTYVYTMW